MEGRAAEEGEAIDVAEVYFAGLQEEMSADTARGELCKTYKEQEEPKSQEKQYRSSQIRVVHDVLIYPRQRVEHCKCLRPLSTSAPSCHSSQPTFILICPKLTPSSSNNGGSPSYPSVPNAASHPVLNPPCSPILPLTPGAPANPAKPLAPPKPEFELP